MAFMASCQSDYLAQNLGENTPITFEATATAVRVQGTSWTPADSVGVSVYNAATAAVIGQNAAYTTAAGDGQFSPAPTALYYPSAGQAVTVTAYYPYSATAVQNGTYHIDLVHGVNNDLLFARNTTPWTSTTGRGTLNFTRQLAAIDFTITTNTDITTAPTVAISGLPTQASINLATGALTTNAASTATYTRTATGSARTWTVRVPVIPGADATQAQVTFAIDTVRRTVALPAGTTFAAGQVTPIAVPVTGLTASTPTPPAPAPNYTAYFETPTITPEQLAANRYVVHTFNGSNERNFALLYSPTLRISYWVAYPLTANNVGSGDRTDDWGYDPKIPQDEQPDLSRSYNGNYSRGHQIASADRLTSRAENAKTFYYTNMTPQNQRLNGGPWATLEGKVRGWRTGTDTLFVVTGAMPTTADNPTIDYTTDRNGKKVAIPKYYFKALAKRVGTQVQTIAFVYNHTANESSDVMSHAISVAELERKTGFTFFPQLTANEKASYTASQWR